MSPARLETLAQRQALAPLEPVTGCYIGAFVVKEQLSNVVDSTGRDMVDPRPFEKLIGKRHAVYFNYLGKMDFPAQEAELLRRRGAALHIAFEPDSLHAIATNPSTQAEVRQFAKDAVASRTPIFLRFASEMNGKWTWSVWGSSPADYIAAFRFFHRALDEATRAYQQANRNPDGSAPPRNVAMVWSPSPYSPIPAERYYPGREYVDWVGLNFYSTLRSNDGPGRPSRITEFIHPLDVLKPLYDRYAGAHPIMIGEWAASQMFYRDNKPRPDFAMRKIGQLYGGAHKLFPRLKAINYFSMNNLKYAPASRRINNFSMFTGRDFNLDDINPVDESDPVARQYSRVISTPYYLRSVSMANRKLPQLNSSVEFLRLENGPAPLLYKNDGRRAVPAFIELSAYVRGSERPLVTWKVAGIERLRTDMPSDYRIQIPVTELPRGPFPVTLTAKVGSSVTTVTRTITVNR